MHPDEPVLSSSSEDLLQGTHGSQWKRSEEDEMNSNTSSHHMIICDFDEEQNRSTIYQYENGRIL